MVCNSCGKIIWFWEPKLWRVKDPKREWHDNEKCNPNNINCSDIQILPSSKSIEDLNNIMNELIRQDRLNKKIKKQQEDW